MTVSNVFVKGIMAVFKLTCLLLLEFVKSTYATMTDTNFYKIFYLENSIFKPLKLQRFEFSNNLKRKWLN